MYRLLRADGETRERRRQATHPAAKRPELLATAPNEVWSWDITRLLGPAKWTYYYLYVIIDIYSRYVPGWLLATRETAALAERLLAETIAKHRIAADQLTLIPGIPGVGEVVERPFGQHNLMPPTEQSK